MKREIFEEVGDTPTFKKVIPLELFTSNDQKFFFHTYLIAIDGEFIPIEQKTGRIPKRPHTSHRRQLLAYIHLVEINTKRNTPYGILQYGNENIHQIIKKIFKIIWKKNQ